MSDIRVINKWERADKAFNKGVEAYIEFGQELARLNADGTTQEEIGQRYQMSHSAVKQACCIGSDARVSNTNSLPKSTYSLYLLTTLDDAGFEKLAKPDTTQAHIKAYKESKKTKALPFPKKEKKVKAPAPAKFNTVMNDTGLSSGKGNTEAVLSIMGLTEVPKKMTTELVEKTADATRTVLSMRGKSIEDTRAEIKTLSESAQKKLARLEATLTRQLEAEFDCRVREAADAMIPDRIAIYETAKKKADVAEMRFLAMSSGIGAHITKNEHRLLLSFFHTDKPPTDEQKNKAFHIITKIGEYVKQVA